jgi:deoxyribonuclease-4
MKFGVHISIAKNFSLAVDRAANLGCETMQIFGNPPKLWNTMKIPEIEFQTFKQKNNKFQIKPVFIHSIYLINLASHNTYFYNQSLVQLIDCLKKAKKIGAIGIVTHLGSAVKLDRHQALIKVAAGIDQVLSQMKVGNFIIENSAGAGNIIGDEFEEIGAIIKKSKYPDRIRVALDTAHAYGAGYDVATAQGLEKTLSQFDKLIGLERLILIHGNDTGVELGSNRDRHANIGEGKIGIEGFRQIINHPKLSHLPMILETPGFKDKNADKSNLQIVKDLDRARLRKTKSAGG